VSALLEVDHLSVDYGGKDPVHAVRDVSLTVQPGEFVGLVGESGCGKTTLAMAVARLERPPARVVAGSVRIAGLDWRAARPEEVRTRRWTDLAIVPQSGMNALNPIMTIAAQFYDVMREHGSMTPEQMRARAEAVLNMVEIDPAVLRRYPHELSGGMKQRVAIALALVLQPKLVVMDEPTTALDMVVQRQILENLRRLRAQQGFAVLFVSHDLGLILELCDRVVVMYAGEVVEANGAAGLLDRPFHPYTRALLRALPDPESPEHGYSAIPGTPPDLHRIPGRCLFAPRCPLARPECHAAPVPLERFGDLELRCRVTREEVAHALQAPA
jgi:oligopeptide/dipeptide ABC transporter ATP-binding protein